MTFQIIGSLSAW